MKARSYETRLMSGMSLEGNTHSVTIPDFTDDTVEDMHQTFRERYGERDTDYDTAEAVVAFVNEEIDYRDPSEMYDPKTGVQLDDEVPLAYAMEHGVGRCKEMAAVGQMLMQREGVNSRYVKAGWEREDGPGWKKHAFLKVETEDGVYHADPTWNEFQPYEELEEELEDQNFREVRQELSLEDGQDHALQRL